MGTSAARGWRWPAGADQGLVAVSPEASAGVAIAAARIAARPRSLDLVIEWLHSSLRTSASDEETHVDFVIFPIVQVLRVSRPIERNSCRARRAVSSQMAAGFRQTSAMRELRR